MNLRSPILALLLAACSAAGAVDGGTALVDAAPAEPIAPRDGQARTPRHPGQPVTVPHSVRGMQVDLNANQCLHCHAPPGVTAPPLRPAAPSVGASHYQWDKGHNVLDGRRYFCLQCHVPQHRAEPIIESGFTAAEDN